MKFNSLTCFFILCQITFILTLENDSVLEKIKNGLSYAKNYIDTAKEIADLVSKSLKEQNNKKLGDEIEPDGKQSNQFNSETLTSVFLRLFGLDSPKLAAITVNSVIFLAQMIGSFFENKETPQARSADSDTEEEPNNFDPFQFIMESRNEKIQHLIKQAQNPELPNQLINQIDLEDSDCIKLLLCKISPIIYSIQSTLNNNSNNKKRFDFTYWFPSKTIFENNSEKCEEKYEICKVFPDE